MARQAALQRRALRPDDRAPDGRAGLTYRGLADEDGPLGRLPEPPRPRQPPGAVERRVAQLAKALGVEPEHFREYRLRVITERLEEMPDLIDRLYKRLGG